MNKPMGRAPGPRGQKMDVSALKRVLGLLFRSYPVLIPIAAFCIAFAAGVTLIPSISRPMTGFTAHLRVPVTGRSAMHV